MLPSPITIETNHKLTDAFAHKIAGLMYLQNMLSNQDIVSGPENLMVFLHIWLYVF